MNYMQLNIPHSVYGSCGYFAPDCITDWCITHGIKYPRYCGSNSSGSGFTNGVTNAESCYTVYDIHESDAVAFKIRFPEVKVYEYIEAFV